MICGVEVDSKEGEKGEVERGEDGDGEQRREDVAEESQADAGEAVWRALGRVGARLVHDVCRTVYIENAGRKETERETVH